MYLILQHPRYLIVREDDPDLRMWFSHDCDCLDCIFTRKHTYVNYWEAWKVLRKLEAKNEEKRKTGSI